MNLFTLPANLPFLDAIAAEWLARAEAAGAGPEDVARGLILLPTRRSARALAEAFLRASGGRALLLPRIVALGALDEAPLALAGALDVPPAVEPMRRFAALTRLVLAMRGSGGAPRTADRAWRLAVELSALMDEADRAEIDLESRLPGAVESGFAAHWSRTLDFLRIVTAAWPAWLAENGLINPAARLVRLLDAQTAMWEQSPPSDRVLLAGTTAAIPAVARLAKAVAQLPNGAVLLPGLDLDLPDAAWNDAGDSHPQAGLRRLLHEVGSDRGDVRVGPRLVPAVAPSGRPALLRRVLLPGSVLRDWQDHTPAEIGGLSRLEPADEQEEAAAIALVLREALETPGARAALVTPDRELAGRVMAGLGRFGVVADDSAGERLAETPPALFLRLLARAVAEELVPVPLLALLKHPLAAGGMRPAVFRAGARELERVCLRGPRPEPGLTGLRRALEQVPIAARRAATTVLARVEACLEPALRMAAAMAVAPSEALDGLIAAAERLAATDESTGAARLWSAEEGDALSERLAAVRDCLPLVPDQPRRVMPGLLDAMLEGAVVRGRRALRGREGAEHPRVFIWGLLEARLQSVEVMVLGGLAEGVWPGTSDPGPWLSRPMRRQVGLPPPEADIGQEAHDFVSTVCAAPRVVLSCPRRRDGAPVVPARWLTRLEMFLAGRNARLATHPAVGWLRVLDQPAGGPRPVAPPRPCPPVARRPRRLSVTEIETWLRDPYAIYARHVLRLTALRPLEQETDAADYGSLVHAGLNSFLGENAARWPANAVIRLREHLVGAMQRARLREALRNWWAPRLERIADWVATTETERRAKLAVEMLWSEVSGTWDLPAPGGRFVLSGRADRIERRADGTLAILDYKTGHPPSAKDVIGGLAPQLPLEAAMAMGGAFGPELTGTPGELCYWHVTGGYMPGEQFPLFRDKPDELRAAVAVAEEKLRQLVDAFDDPTRCYLSQPHPGRAPRYSDYVQLARVAEWAAAGDEA